MANSTLQYGYIYRITNLVNNKSYIGQHKNSSLSDSYFGSGTLLKKAIKKHGRENFRKEILKSCQNKEELDKEEVKFIALEWENGAGEYNISSGGGSNSNFWSEDLRKEKSLYTKELWSREEYKKKQEKAKKIYYDYNGGRLEKSVKMKSKWREPEYSSLMRAKLSSTEVKNKISVKESVSRLSNRRKYSAIYQLRWHNKLHCKDEDYRNTCGFCVKEKLVEPISLLDIKDILDNKYTADKKTAVRVRTIAKKFSYNAEEILAHILEAPDQIVKDS